jgi:predicted outer membrane protein
MNATSKHVRLALAAAAGGTLLFGCQNQRFDETPRAMAQSQELTAGSGDEGAQLSEDQIVGVLASANESQITLGHMTADNLLTPDLRRYAGDMIMSHSQAQVRLSQLSEEQAMSVDDSPVAQEFSDSEGSAEQTLAREPIGRDYDMKYAAAEAQHHQQVIALIDNQLMQDARSERTITELQKTRAEASTHAGRINEIAAQLSPLPPPVPRREY